MSNRYGKNFTGFQNLFVKGSSTSAPVDQGVIEMGAGLTNANSTISISLISGSTVGSVNGSKEVPFFHISNAGLSIGTGYIRIVPFGGSNSGTLAVNTSYNDSDRAWTLPSKSGTFGVSGTFTVNLPAVSANDISNTNVVVSGIRAEDGLICTIQNMSTTGIGTRGYVFIGGATPTNTGINLTFINATDTATIYSDLIVAYTAVR